MAQAEPASTRSPGSVPRPVRDEPAVGPVEQVLALVEATRVDLDGFYDDEARALTESGLTPELATAALSVLAERCKDRRTPVCGHSGQEKLLREALVQWLGDHGDLSSATVLLRLDHHGDYGAGLALEAALTRRMQATPSPCSAPTEAEVAMARAALPSFVVLEHKGGLLEGRAATEAELDDLAYFLAAVADNGEPVGEHVDTLRSGSTPSEEEQREREARLADYERALAAGDYPRTLKAGSAYLRTLGHPGPIDLSRETDMTWGGARFSHVMRDVALAAELSGQPGLAADLYRRANPGGGACGTSVSYRETTQLEGLIRSEEARGRCRAVVAERLVNREGRADSPYGPRRLAEAGFDLARLYRGALVTRHRDRDRVEVEAAIARAPAAVREAGLERLRVLGPEAWEQRVWATEGLAAEIGRPGVELLLPLVDRADPELRARMIAAIGDAAARPFMGPCQSDMMIGLSSSWSSAWSRSVWSFGEDCSTWVTDDEADAMARRMMPALVADQPELRAAAAEALGHLAAPIARRPLRRALKRARAETEQCEAAGHDECWRAGDVGDAAERALERLDAAATARGPSSFEF